MWGGVYFGLGILSIMVWTALWQNPIDSSMRLVAHFLVDWGKRKILVFGYLSFSFSPFYSIPNSSLWDGTAHIQGRASSRIFCKYPHPKVCLTGNLGIS
ncbi:hypothetical protein I79_021631 [Cricetulus griseus]|uniref:Uncharacterized protein n=1 Tax=Cricetulus griseus TaxID=10029 RepID=G3ID59_CRIGR|nr:hypothetical protein I79_021631 [Cricetulus griseus]